MKQKYVIAIIALIVIAGGVYWYISQNKAVAPETNTGTEQTDNPDANFIGDVPGDSPDNNPTIPTADTVAVSTQVTGSSVTIDNAFLEKPGFISIHEVDSKGKAGAIIGTSGLLGIGAKQDLEVKATLKAGSKYIAMLRVDDGDKKFDTAKDVAVMKNGIAVMTMFSVSQ